VAHNLIFNFILLEALSIFCLPAPDRCAVPGEGSGVMAAKIGAKVDSLQRKNRHSSYYARAHWSRRKAIDLGISTIGSPRTPHSKLQ